jgi:hypothetical protein
VLEHRARIGERDRAMAEARDRTEGGARETTAANVPLPQSRRNTGALLAEQNVAFAAQRQRHLHEPLLTRLARIFNDPNERDTDGEADELNDNEHQFRWSTFHSPKLHMPLIETSMLKTHLTKKISRKPSR